MKIVELDAHALGELASALQLTTAVHLKGFGPTMVPPSLHTPPDALVEELLASDVLVFDGDDNHDASFTFAVQAAFKAAQRDGAVVRRLPTLLAFTFRSERERFWASWAPWHPGPDRVSGEEGVLYLHLVDDSGVAPMDMPAWVTAGGGGTEAHASLAECVQTVRTGHGARYVQLGVAALDATATAGLTQTVVAWGGWDIVACEYAVSVSTRGSTLPWRYYHAVRSPGGEAPQKQEGRLLRMRGLPALTVVQGRGAEFD